MQQGVSNLAMRDWVHFRSRLQKARFVLDSILGPPIDCNREDEFFLYGESLMSYWGPCDAIWVKKGQYSVWNMVIRLYGCSFYSAHIWSKAGILIC